MLSGFGQPEIKTKAPKLQKSEAGLIRLGVAKCPR
jgi:hypothetical protein